MKRIRLKLSDRHNRALEELADHYGVPVSTLGQILLSRAIDAEGQTWPDRGPIEPRIDTNGPNLGTIGPDCAQADRPGTLDRAQKGHKRAEVGHDWPRSSPGTDPAILGSERERERDPDSLNPPSVAELTAELVELLNTEGGTKHSPHDPASQRAVFNRLRGEGCEAATPADMRRVVKGKAQAWRGSKYAHGLTLLTLLGDRFGQYLGTLDVDNEGSESAGGGAFDYLGGP